MMMGPVVKKQGPVVLKVQSLLLQKLSFEPVAVGNAPSINSHRTEICLNI